ncbi:MAG: hypothetical protein WCR70_01920 [Sphaerochaetaceae bacterium]
MNQKGIGINSSQFRLQALEYLEINKRSKGRNARPRGLHCPNPDCICNRAKGFYDRPWYSPHGTYHNAAQGKVRRYRCQYCGATFSERQATDHWYLHRDDIDGYSLVYDWLVKGYSLSMLALHHDCSIQAIITRVKRAVCSQPRISGTPAPQIRSQACSL